MAYSTPPTYPVGDPLTSTWINTYIKANFDYLKGTSGAFALSAMFSATAADTTARTTSGSAELSVINSDDTGGQRYAGVTFKTSGSVASGGIFQAARMLGTFFSADFSNGALMLQTASGASSWRDVMTLRGTNVGIGTVAPQGVLHTYGGISGLAKWESNGLAGTTQTIIPDAAGDVTIGCSVWYFIQSSGGTVQAGSGLSVLTQSGTSFTNIYSNASDTVQLRINTTTAPGALEVQRTGGSLTYKVSFVIQWM